MAVVEFVGEGVQIGLVTPEPCALGRYSRADRRGSIALRACHRGIAASFRRLITVSMASLQMSPDEGDASTISGSEKRYFYFLFSSVFLGGERTDMECAICPWVSGELHQGSRSPRTPSHNPVGVGLAVAYADSGPRPRAGVPFQYQDKRPETQRRSAV